MRADLIADANDEAELGEVNEALPQEGARTAHFDSMWGTRSCSLRITESVRKNAAELGLPEEAALKKGMEE